MKSQRLSLIQAFWGWYSANDDCPQFLFWYLIYASSTLNAIGCRRSAFLGWGYTSDDEDDGWCPVFLRSVLAILNAVEPFPLDSWYWLI